MRIQHWCAPILSVFLMLLSNGHILAQYDPAQQPPAAVFNAGSPSAAQAPLPIMTAAGAEFSAQQPGFVNPGQSSYMAGYGAVPAMPQAGPAIAHGMQPWPNISPFENQFSQYTHENGRWFHEANNRGRRFLFTADALISKYRLPRQRLIGAENVTPGIPLPGDSTNVFWPAARTRTDVFNAFPRETGTRLRWGFVDPDDTGAEISGWWSGTMEEHVKFGGKNPNEFNLLSLRVGIPTLPLYDGVGVVGDSALTGQNARYDKNVVFGYEIEAYGAGVNWILTPLWKRRYAKIQSIWGIRYIGIRESFGFLGSGTGLIGYTVNVPVTGVNQFLTPDPDASMVTQMADPFRGTFLSTVQSHMGGPEIGLRMDLGGDNLMFRGEAKAGVMGNHEEMKLNGAGLGNPFVEGYNPKLVFDRAKTHTHLSPTLEASLVAEFQPFAYIPLLKRMHWLEKAKLRLGYSVLGVWRVARPSDTVNYIAPPNNLQITTRYTRWYVHSMNAGLRWEY